MLVLILLCPIVILLSGFETFPVSEPLSDLAKAKPDKRLLGKWSFKLKDYGDIPGGEIDIPAVKGNPKELMRAVFSGGPQTQEGPPPTPSFWSFQSEPVDFSLLVCAAFSLRGLQPPGSTKQLIRGKRPYCRRVLRVNPVQVLTAVLAAEDFDVQGVNGIGGRGLGLLIDGGDTLPY
jgi:hypothetical protein